MNEVSYYEGKSRDLPRKMYRVLIEDIAAAGGDIHLRNQVIKAFIDRVRSNHGSADYLGLKLCLPDSVKASLSADERSEIDAVFSALRSRRARRLFPIFPVCTDEVSIRQEFLESVFDGTNVPLFGQDTRVLTMGSCFAVNISKYLSSVGYNNISGFRRAEEINSVTSNLLMLEVAALSEKEQIKFFSENLSFFNESKNLKEFIRMELKQIRSLKKNISSAEVVVITLGNTIDGYLPQPISAVTRNLTIPNLVPRFLKAFQSENIKHQVKALSVLKERGGTLRTGRLSEVLRAINALIDAVFKLNDKAKIVITVSPVPINNTMGLENPNGLGPVEIDCQMKSTLRACLGEILEGRRNENLHYFPSFEIVRWIGAYLSRSAFGNEDAATGHVSDEILNSVYRLFLTRHALNPTAH